MNSGLFCLSFSRANGSGTMECGVRQSQTEGLGAKRTSAWPVLPWLVLIRREAKEARRIIVKYVPLLLGGEERRLLDDVD